jgi:hypothetical protein
MEDGSGYRTMRLLNKIFTILAIAVITASLGCAGNASNPMQPFPDEPAFGNAYVEPGERLLWGQWDLTIDLSTSEVILTPLRATSGHYDVTAMLSGDTCPDCVSVDIVELLPAEHYLKLNITLRNPSGLSARDVRGLLMAQADGVIVSNADSYTSLWDDGGDVTMNPFMAYAKEQPFRVFGPYTGHSCIYEINYPVFSNLLSLQLGVDASWPGNCLEPYEVRDAYATGVFLDTQKNDIICEVKSWNNNVNTVVIYSAECLGYELQIPMEPLTGDWWIAKDIKWQNGGSAAGEYNLMIAAKTFASGIPIVNRVPVTIEAFPVTTGWVRAFGGYGNDEANATAVDDLGNAYIGGYFEGIVDFDPGPGEHFVDSAYYDSFICKFDPQGNFIWVRTWGCDDTDYVADLVIDQNGDLYVVGYFRGDIDLDPGPLVNWHSSDYDPRIFLSKFDPDGYFYDGRSWGDESYIEAFGVDTDPSGNVYITGAFKSALDFDPGPDVEEYTSAGDEDSFLISLDQDLDFRWARTWGTGSGSDDDYGYDVATDTVGHVFVTGQFGSIVDFNPGPGVDELAAVDSFDVYLSCFNTGGDFAWARSWGGTSTDRGRGIDVDQGGNIYVTGEFNYTVDFDPGPGEAWITSVDNSDSFIAKFNNLGVFAWADSYGGENDDIGWDICVSNSQDRVFMTGETSDDILITCHSLDGEFLWDVILGGEDNDSGYGVAANMAGDVFLTGTFRETVDFRPGPGFESYQSVSGSYDIFLLKMTKDGIW